MTCVIPHNSFKGHKRDEFIFKAFVPKSSGDFRKSLDLSRLPKLCDEMIFVNFGFPLTSDMFRL